MNVRERRQMVLERLQDTGEVSVAELSAQADVSDMTIRRDLEALERLGALKRVHGGAVTGVSRSYEPPFALRVGRSADAKARIGTAAAATLEDGDTAIVDVGSTALELARALRDAAHLTVLTPSLRVAAELADNPGIRLIVSGGIARPGELSLIGGFSERVFEELRPDVLFLGVGGVDRSGGLTEFNLEDTRVKRAAVASARRCVVLADESKLGQVAFARIGALERADALITDCDDEARLAPIRDAGVEVVTV